MSTQVIRQIILIPLIILSFIFISWQLYQEYSLILIQPKLSANVLLFASEKLQHALKEQEANLGALAEKINQAARVEELASFIDARTKESVIAETPIDWGKVQITD